jgi:starch phosphorylase
MKRALRTLSWRFNADRMVMDYARLCYRPAAGGESAAMPCRRSGTGAAPRVP